MIVDCKVISAIKLTVVITIIKVAVCCYLHEMRYERPVFLLLLA